MHDRAPQELLDGLRYYYQLSFVPILFADCDELRRYLGIEGDDPPWFVDMWKEYLEYDSILAHDGNGGVYRFIRTVTLYVVRDRTLNRRTVRETLVETVEWPDDTATKRTFNNTASEKIHFKMDGVWVLYPGGWRRIIRRAGTEEFGILLTRRYLRYPWLRRISKVLYYKDPESGSNSTLSVKRDDPKRPHVTTYNRLYHFFLKFHRRFWKQQYREEKRDEFGNLIKTMVHHWVVASSAP